MQSTLGITASCTDTVIGLSDRICECRELGPAISTIAAEKIRPIQLRDFVYALKQSKPSVNRKQLDSFERWTEEFGTKG